jgi:hypothetical protein
MALGGALVEAPEPRVASMVGAAPTDCASADAALADISGTVKDVNGDIVPGATVLLKAPPPAGQRTVTASDTGFFDFGSLQPGLRYVIVVSAPSFESWTSPPLEPAPGQYINLSGISLGLPNAVTSVTVLSSPVEIATQQVRIEEQQRVLGIIPNFYVVYDSKNAVAMTARLKFQMALKVSIDPVSFAGAVFVGAINQSADTPDYRQGWVGYGQRVGAVYADGFTDTMFGGAILPWLFHQDPRYYYQGTGTIKSRALHALSGPFLCKGDNGKWQPNFSSVGGDLISASISNVYYPSSNRGLGWTFENLLIDTAQREASTLIQEFLLRKLTPSAKKQKLDN